MAFGERPFHSVQVLKLGGEAFTIRGQRLHRLIDDRTIVGFFRLLLTRFRSRPALTLDSPSLPLILFFHALQVFDRISDDVHPIHDPLLLVRRKVLPGAKKLSEKQVISPQPAFIRGDLAVQVIAEYRNG